MDTYFRCPGFGFLSKQLQRTCVLGLNPASWNDQITVRLRDHDQVGFLNDTSLYPLYSPNKNIM